MNEQTDLLREIRDLLQVIAEPALARRDEGLRASLREIVGKSKAKAGATLLMDGSRTQIVICKESGIDRGRPEPNFVSSPKQSTAFCRRQESQVIDFDPAKFLRKRREAKWMKLPMSY